MNKKLKTICLSFILSIFIILTPVIFFLNFDAYYFLKFDNLNIYKNFSNTYTDEYLDYNFRDVLKYINWRDSEIETNFFSQEDQVHLKDVRSIVGGIYVVYLSSFLIALSFKDFYKKNNKHILNNLIIINWSIVSISVLGVFAGFSRSFELFHKFMFRNDYWLLDPQTSNLIKYLPESVFQEIATFILLFVIITTILLTLNWRTKITKSS